MTTVTVQYLQMTSHALSCHWLLYLIVFGIQFKNSFFQAFDVLLPYGPGQGDKDIFDLNLTNLDDSSFQLNLPQGFLFGCTVYYSVTVNINGCLQFGNFSQGQGHPSMISFRSAYPNDGDLIAPLYKDLDFTSLSGHLYHQCYNRLSESDTLPSYQQTIFDLVTAAIVDKSTYHMFNPTIVGVFTWIDVHTFSYPKFNNQTWNQTASFQVVIAGDSRTSRSYTMFNYKSINWAIGALQSCTQGYESVTDCRAFFLPTSSSVLFRNLPVITGNTGIAGRWQFLISSPGCNKTSLESTRTANESSQFSVLPLFGPLAGGTNITITAKDKYQLVNVSRIYIGKYMVLSTMSQSNDEVISAITPLSLNVGPVMIRLIYTDQHTIFICKAFTYKPNPVINSIYPTSHLVSGGTMVTINGTGMNSVAYPLIQLTVVVTQVSVANETRSYSQQNCEVGDGTSEYITCSMPELNLTQIFEKALEDNVLNNSMSQKTNNATSIVANGSIFKVVLPNNLGVANVYLGFNFDGFHDYHNISSALPDLQFLFFTPPTISSKTDVIDIQENNPKILTIEGEHMTRGSRMVDYRVTIGDGGCSNKQLSDNELSCLPPNLRPTQNLSTSLCSTNSTDILHIHIFVGFQLYFYGCGRYINAARWPLIVGCTVGIGLTLILAGIVVTIVCVYRRKGKPMCCTSQSNDTPIDSGTMITVYEKILIDRVNNLADSNNHIYTHVMPNSVQVEMRRSDRNTVDFDPRLKKGSQST